VLDVATGAGYAADAALARRAKVTRIRDAKARGPRDSNQVVTATRNRWNAGKIGSVRSIGRLNLGR